MKLLIYLTIVCILYGCKSADRSTNEGFLIEHDDLLFTIIEEEPAFENGFFGAIIHRPKRSDGTGNWEKSEHLKFRLTVDTAQTFVAEYVILGRNEKNHQDTLIYIFPKQSIKKSALIYKDAHIDTHSMRKVRIDTFELEFIDVSNIEISTRSFEIFKFSSLHFNDEDYIDNIRFYGIRSDTMFHYWVPDLGIIKLDTRNPFTAFSVDFSDGTDKEIVTKMILEELNAP